MSTFSSAFIAFDGECKVKLFLIKTLRCRGYRDDSMDGMDYMDGIVAS